MTYVYADSTAVVGPLAVANEPGSYNLCAAHAESISAPRGWEIIRLPMDSAPPLEDDSDDLLALADVVRAIGLRHDDVEPDVAQPDPVSLEPAPLRQVGHLRLISSEE